MPLPPSNQTVRINSTVPVYNLTVNATNSPTAQLLTNGLTVLNNLTISGGTLNANNLNLNVGGHWTNNGAFTPGTGTVTFDGMGNQNLGGGHAPSFNNLTLNHANGLTLSGGVDATVNATLTLTSGVMATGGNKLIIPATGAVARTSGHIFWPTAKTCGQRLEASAVPSKSVMQRPLTTRPLQLPLNPSLRPAT
ncbi:MAG: hypothetical protein IPK76_21250 [Lewinellaceae bacterium]|nr:hypothetical protein [Lewinellaceae bacterium]